MRSCLQACPIYTCKVDCHCAPPARIGGLLVEHCAFKSSTTTGQLFRLAADKCSMLTVSSTLGNGTCACAQQCCFTPDLDRLTEVLDRLTEVILDRLSGQDRLILTAYSGRPLAVTWQQARAMYEKPIAGSAPYGRFTSSRI